MGKIKKSFSGFGFKEFMYFVFILSTMYYFPFKLYKECESIDYSLEDAAKAMYLIIIPIMVCLISFVYSSYWSYSSSSICCWGQCAFLCATFSVSSRAIVSCRKSGTTSCGAVVCRKPLPLRWLVQAWL